MPPPLQLRLTARKPRILAGEGIVLGIVHRVFSDLEMETVELNRSRTSLRITPVGERGQILTLCGADHAALHGIHPLTEIGRRFRAPAGSAWTSDLQLLNYACPLAAGRYRIELSYRYGDSAQDTCASNPVDVEVVPAMLLTSDFRWFGGSAARDQLATLWTARDGSRVHWIFQTARGMDPGAILSAVDLEVPDPLGATPELAHLNDIASFHYERYVVWVDGSRVGWLKASDEQRLSESASTSHGLDGQPVCADPPLQRRGGGFFAVLVGRAKGAPSFSVVEADQDGNVQTRLVSVGDSPQGSAVVAWSEQEETATGSVFFIGSEPRSIVQVDLSGGPPRSMAARGEVLRLALDQWLGRANILALIRREGRMEVLRWNLARPREDGQVVSRYDLEGLGPDVPGGDPSDATPLCDSLDLALLFPGRNIWAVLSRGEKYLVAATEGSNVARLVASPGGLFLVEFVPDSGFLATRIGEPRPPDLI